MSDHFVDPVTGELFEDLDQATDEQLAEFLEHVDDAAGALRDTRAALDRTIVGRMDRAAGWTRHVGPYKLSAPSPKPTSEWNGEQLEENLWPLVQAGLIDQDAMTAAVEVVPTYKVKKAGVNSLAALGGPLAAMVERLRREQPKGHRTVKLERLRRAAS